MIYYITFFVNTMTIGLLAPILAFNVLNYMPWTMIFLISQFFGIRLYYIRDEEECTRIQNRIQYYSHTADGGKGYGYSVGFWYVLYVSKNDGDFTVYMVATAASFKRLTEEGDDEESLFDQGWMPPTNTEQNRINIFERTGSYANQWFRKRQREGKEVACGQQGNIVSEIVKDYVKRKHTVAYIHGEPGTGKSMVGILVANEFGSHFCNTLKLWQPGDTLATLICEVEPTPQKPLVIVFDEFDAVIEKIHVGIPPHKNIPIVVADKAGWNHMLDSIQRGMYPNIILILTSNRGPDYIKSLDPSYIRKGRVDLTFEMTESIL